MGYKNLRECLEDLEKTGRLRRVEVEVDADLEAGAIQRRVFRAGGPALLFTRVKGCAFPLAANIFGAPERIRFIFRDALRAVDSLLRLKADPAAFFKSPRTVVSALPALMHARPRMVDSGPVLAHEIAISDLPRLRSWPLDGGPYATLPQVYSESPSRPGFGGSNLGMYRIQLLGNDYAPDQEVGLHYQIHRGIGPHHAEAIARGLALRVNVFVGGPPAMTLAAVMPLPEGVAEIFFAGAMAGRRLDMIRRPGRLPVPAEADFVISGHVEPGRVLPEGPFGDHLGYYSLAHDFPVLRVESVSHRPDAIWPFTTVGRPPQEDTVFGEFIHELTAALVPRVFSGVREVHAVDAAGVHPLLLAVGSERYTPFAKERRPQELLTEAFCLLGSTQTSLSKYLLIAAAEDAPGLSCRRVPGFLDHVLRRFDPARDLHFVTRTTMDTLDYSGISLNQGSKLVWAAAGPPRRELSATLPPGLGLPPGFADPRLFAPGIWLVRGPAHVLGRDEQDQALIGLGQALEAQKGLEGLPLLAVVDDPGFCAASWDNFLWVVFTRSDPATDIYGAGAFTRCKHWGCSGPLIIDARLKSYHAPALEPDPDIERRVDALAAPGGPLHGIA
ncbi:MAG: UbiD family decarboxylase [Desulfovibrionaceae bacterium]|nr:UbiD family decarboxylase [Desulfovibrionaceae bacterium]